MPTQALLKEIQRSSGLSQAELARRAGIPRSVLNVYLRGRREPGAEALRRIAAAGGFDLGLIPRRAPVDEERASKILVQVLELAEALPFRPRAEMEFPPLRERLAKREALVSRGPSARQASKALSRRRSASLCVPLGSSTASLRSASQSQKNKGEVVL